MSSNHNKALNNAISERDGEYYTLYNDIAAELPHYKSQLRGKRIICPCDWDESYNEEIVFMSETEVKHQRMFGNGSIKNLDIFPLFKNGKIWIGHARELSGFMRPDGTILSKKDPEGSNARASRWYTNLDVSCRHDKLIMTENYIEGKYPKILVFGGYFLGGKARNLGAKKFDFMENGFST